MNYQDMFDNESPKTFVKHTEETRAAIGQAGKGRKHTEESRAKFKAARAQQVFTKEHRESMSKAAKNRPPISEETRAKLSLTSTGRPGSRVSRNGKAIVIPNGGQFPSMREAANWAQANGLVNAHKKIQAWLKKYPTHYYYV